MSPQYRKRGAPVNTHASDPGTRTCDPLLDLLASERTIAYRPSFARLTGSVTAAVLLSQFLYWSYNEAAQQRGGWFWKTMPEIEAETGLTRREQDTSRKRLRDMNLLEEEKRGIPMKIWFRVDRPRLMDLLRETGTTNLGGNRQDCPHETAKIESADPPRLIGANRQPTSETTSETTHKTPLRAAPPAPQEKGGTEREPLHGASPILKETMAALRRDKPIHQESGKSHA